VKFIRADLEGVIIVEPAVHKDERGFFLETYNARSFRDAGIPEAFVQDNHSRSVRGTLRGLHAQRLHPQGKLVRAVRGEIFDVAVDIRPRSPTFKRWIGVVLSAETFREVYIPAGFLHGFCVLSEHAEVEYKCTDFYAPGDELGVIWNDPEIGIRWPVAEPILSAKDRGHPRLSEVLDRITGGV
jgi:dTDP-4-dehydrorhamnose 3,5-epimerase